MQQDGLRLDRRSLVALCIGDFAIFWLVMLAIKTTALNAGQMAIWPGDGIILALMFGPLRRTPIVALITGMAAVVSSEVFCGNIPQLALSLAVVNAISLYGVFFATTRLCAHGDLIQSTSFIKFMFLATLGSALTAAVLAVIVKNYYNISSIDTFISSTMGNVTGDAVLTPLILIFTGSVRLQADSHKSRLKRGGMATIYLAGLLAVFIQSSAPLLFLVPLGLMAVAYMASLTELAACVLATVVCALVASAGGHGPIGLVRGGPEAHLFTLQAFLVIITGTSLPIAALMAEHASLKASLLASRQEAVAANQAKSAFLAMISHEIRTPLNGVLGTAQILAMDDLTPRQRDHVAVVSRSGETLLALLNDVLDLSKIEAGKMTLETIAFDLALLLQATVKTFDVQARTKGLALRLNVAAAAGIYDGDPTRLQQIVSNLISNALKFTEAGRVDVQADYGANGLTISVTDTGIGIAPDKVGRLFMKFSQVDESTTRRFGGTGLGLSICRELVEMMGGVIDVQSEEGAGTRFSVILPLKRLQDEQTPRARVEPIDEIAKLAGLRVLAAEDNATNQIVLKTLLEAVGVGVAIVGDGAKAVEAWEGDVFDLILMDVQMPVLDGVGAARAIRAREAELGRACTPILALTANAMMHQMAEYRLAGMDGFVAKPIAAPLLFAAMMDAMREADSGSERFRRLGSVNG
jgi:signal transduction histidine kinase/AmiR/NasT family two-component response regulator